MNVIGAGFGRTGTLSLKTALERLGEGPCAHMVDMLGDDERCRHFTRAARGDRAGLTKAFDGYRATVDWPGCYFWRELAEQHPKAKIILTVRDPEEWYASAERTIWTIWNSPLPPGMKDFVEMCDATNWTGAFGGRFGDRDHAIDVYLRHNEAVRRTVPADRLLEFAIGQGWEPLCDFLNRPIPAEPFPRLNDSKTFNADMPEVVRQMEDAPDR
ncbi:sulfotransferase family protein [Actinoplanes sp. NPDC051851]|uniref:sulfotransferase family protein n=1 Tax=Actinoplanes sp. NPDC051851 TaxID=3154753 RepID=UPI00341AF355